MNWHVFTYYKMKFHEASEKEAKCTNPAEIDAANYDTEFWGSCVEREWAHELTIKYYEEKA